MKNNMQ